MNVYTFSIYAQEIKNYNKARHGSGLIACENALEAKGFALENALELFPVESYLNHNASVQLLREEVLTELVNKFRHLIY